MEQKFYDRAKQARAKLMELRASLDCDGRAARAREIENLMGQPGFWDDQDKAQALMDELKATKGVIKPFDEALADAKNVAEVFDSLGMEFVANFEFQNFGYDCTSPDGVEWALHEGGLHRLNVPREFIEALGSKGNLAGIEYDEFEHCIINRNISIELASKGRIKAPVFELCNTRET